MITCVLKENVWNDDIYLTKVTIPNNNIACGKSIVY